MIPSRYLSVTLAIAAALSVGVTPPQSMSKAVAQEHDHDHDRGHDHGHGHDHDDGGAGMPSHVAMTPADAKAAGAVLAVAGPGLIPLTLNATGTIVPDSAAIARARARFAGLVRDVRGNVGDKVAAGAVLATVESNDSLQTYPVKSPIAGVVISRHANVGEVADNSAMFVVADPARVTAEAHVGLADIARVAIGQAAMLSSAGGSVTGLGAVASLQPIVDAATQTALVRITPSDADGRWRSGMMIDAAIVHATREVPIAVPAAAIQTYDETTVVFVEAGARFEVRPVLLGATGGDVVEVIEGLYAGETYVSANSKVMKGGK